MTNKPLHLRVWAVVLVLFALPAQASIFQGETLDAVANGIAWVALVVVPITVIILFWLVHILPEKIAEKRKHPQTQAIQTLCLLSLFFGGMLWPLAWLWAYSKPVLYKMAYGTDVAEPEHGAQHAIESADQDGTAASQRSHTKVVGLERQAGDRTNTSSERS